MLDNKVVNDVVRVAYQVIEPGEVDTYMRAFIETAPCDPLPCPWCFKNGRAGTLSISIKHGVFSEKVLGCRICKHQVGPV